MKYMLSVTSKKKNYHWELKRFVSSDEMMELHCELYWEGIHSDSQWWLARWHENPDGYWDTEESGGAMEPWYSYHPAMLNLRSKLTEKEIGIASGKKRGSLGIFITTGEEK